MTRLVLLGAGHAHAQVLAEFAKSPLNQLEIILVSPVVQAPYSGMVPGWLAGHYGWEECCIDFERLCHVAGAHLRIDSAAGIDPARSEVHLAGGTTLSYDLLSLDIGSTLAPPEHDALTVLPMRPLASLQKRWDQLLQHVAGLEDGASFRLLMVGGGAAGVESALSAAHRLRNAAPAVRFQFSLVTHGNAILPGLAPGAGRRLGKHLTTQGIAISTGFGAQDLDAHGVRSDDGRTIAADAVMWATGAQAYTWPKSSGLACDERGFVRIDASLRSLSHPRVFAAGDCAALDPPLPKAGVFAVRMGPILAHNLRAAIERRPLRDYRPQRRFLVLIGTGGAHAVGTWGRFAWQGDWVWRWKQKIDQRFVTRYNTLDSR